MLIFQLDQKLLFPALLGEEAKRQLEKLLAYENANQECQKAIAPIHETGTIIDYLKACPNLGLESQMMQMLAETVAAALRKGKSQGKSQRKNKEHYAKDLLIKTLLILLFIGTNVKPNLENQCLWLIMQLLIGDPMVCGYLTAQMILTTLCEI